jgi:hypothetical protein
LHERTNQSISSPILHLLVSFGTHYLIVEILNLLLRLESRQQSKDNGRSAGQFKFIFRDYPQHVDPRFAPKIELSHTLTIEVRIATDFRPLFVLLVERHALPGNYGCINLDIN